MLDRRDFIRIVVTGSLGVTACRAPGGGAGASGAGADAGAGGGAGAAATADAAAATPGTVPPATGLSRETLAICHAVRDGETFRMPVPSRHLPVVIVGGGAAGLFAARELGDRPFLLLEKEAEVGGNATGGSWRGVGYSSGTSYNNDTGIQAIAADLGVPLRSIDSVDGLIVGDQFIPEFLTTGLDRSPFPPAVRDGFRRFFATYRDYDVDREVERLDNLPLDAILKDYPRELRDFLDAFGPNSWGGRVADTSAYVGIQGASWVGGIEPARYTGDEGFGALTRALAARLEAGAPGCIRRGATVVRVQPDGGRILVAWLPGAEGAAPTAPDRVRLECVSADTVIVAASKFIARHLVAGLPEEQREAMGRIRYIPYLVTNLCFDGVVHDACFDTNVIASPIISDVVCADWPRLRGRGPADRPTVLSCYMPLTEADRAAMLDEAEARRLALLALEAVDRWFPGAAGRCREIRAHLRGHPMHLSACGMITRWGPRASRSLGAIHFAGTDGVGAVSDMATSLSSARVAARAAIASLDAAARARG